MHFNLGYRWKNQHKKKKVDRSTIVLAVCLTTLQKEKSFLPKFDPCLHHSGVSVKKKSVGGLATRWM
jgi:hypothetical protein